LHVDFIVTVDTEADRQWDHGIPLACDNVSYLPAFQRVCDAHGVVPTYLVTSEIAGHPLAQRLLGEWAGSMRAEVGAHLHPWTTAPFRDEPGLRFNDARHLFPNELPDDLLTAKIERLTAQIEASVGARPVSYRAGRFGMNAASACALADLGYVVDSSVTPSVSWQVPDAGSGPRGGPDFRGHSCRPFLIAESGDPELLELPVTVLVTDRWVRRYPELAKLAFGRPVRLTRRLLRGRVVPQPMWLRPFPSMRAADLKSVWHVAEAEGLPAAVMMLHSSELMPGGSPYRPTRRSITSLLATLDEFFRFVRRMGGTPVCLTEGARRASASTAVERRSL
jgi:hypothetical protein